MKKIIWLLLLCLSGPAFSVTYVKSQQMMPCSASNASQYYYESGGSYLPVSGIGGYDSANIKVRNVVQGYDSFSNIHSATMCVYESSPSSFVEMYVVDSKSFDWTAGFTVASIESYTPSSWAAGSCIDSTKSLFFYDNSLASMTFYSGSLVAHSSGTVCAVGDVGASNGAPLYYRSADSTVTKGGTTAKTFTATVDFANYCEINSIIDDTTTGPNSLLLVYDNAASVGIPNKTGAFYYGTSTVTYSCTFSGANIALMAIKKGDRLGGAENFFDMCAEEPSVGNGNIGVSIAESANTAVCLSRDFGADFFLGTDNTTHGSSVLLRDNGHVVNDTKVLGVDTFSSVSSNALSFGDHLTKKLYFGVKLNGKVNKKVPKAAVPYYGTLTVTIFE